MGDLSKGEARSAARGAEARRLRAGPWRLAAALSVAALLVGAVVAVHTARTADRRMRARLLTQARMAAEAVNERRLGSLSGTDADLANPDYRRLKEQLTRVRGADPACRFAYLLGRRADGTVFIVVDSEPPESPDYSPPGQTYDEVSAESRDVFVTGRETVEGPISDRWGTWVSALVPVLDPETKTPAAVLGMDIDARHWRRTVAAQCVAPAAVTLAVVLLVIMFALVYGRKVMQTRRLAASEARYRALFESSHDAIMLLDREGFFDCNPATLRTFGCPSRERFLERHPADWSPPTQPDGQDSRTAAQRRIESALAEGSQSFEWTHRRQDGALFPAEVLLSRVECGERTVLQASVRDIGARREAEIRARRERGLIALGTMAGGMAHEINNPVMGIINYAELIADNAAGNALLLGYAAEIAAEGRRVARMTHSLLASVQPPTGEAATPVTPAEIMARVLPAAETAARERGIALSVRIPTDLPELVCRRDRVGTALAALLANALEAFDGKTLDARHLGTAGKEIVVTAQTIGCATGGRTLPLSGDPLSEQRRSRPAIRITIEDNGLGISKAALDRVVDPFFTTKDRTRHAGLGLWTARSIADEHGGELKIESEEGKGTRAHLELPVEGTRNAEVGTANSEGEREEI